MIRGMSYPKGVFYMDREHIAHATITKDGNIATTLLPFGTEGLWFFIKRTCFTLPIYFIVGLIFTTLWIWKQPGFPFYFLLLVGFGYHFVFPYPLKQYHGAEHKVFSYQGKKTMEALEAVRSSNIVNRNCSTNNVITFYLLFLLGYYPLGGNGAACLGLIGVWAIPRFLKPIDQKIIFPISAYFQRHVTTVEPETRHLKAALLSYISLNRKEAVNEEMLLEEQRMDKEKLRLQKLHEERERILKETEYLEI